MTEPVCLVVLAVGWALWATLHSLLIWPSVQNRFRSFLGSAYRFYRIGYNLFAGLSIVPLLMLEQRFAADILFDWPGFYLWLRVFLVAIAGGLLLAGVLTYPMKEFIGWSLIKDKAEAELSPLIIKGVSRFVRHPWYLAGFFLLWSRIFTPATLLSSTLLSIYLVIGAILEEDKLLQRYGEAYREYQQRVPMFLPKLWSRLK